MAIPQIDIFVNDMGVMRMIEAAENAVSEQSLMEFLMDDASDWFRQRIYLRFFAGGDSATGKWDQLQESTGDIREALGYERYRPINVRSGDLRDWLLQSREFSPEPGGASMRIPGDIPSIELEEKLRTAQQGRAVNPIPNFGPTPPRPVLDMDEEDLFQIMFMFAKHFAMRLELGMS